MEQDKQSRTVDQKAIMLVAKEYNRAGKVHNNFHSAHEGLSVIREELQELQTEVFKKDRDKSAMREEAVQLAAMALRFIVDVCPPDAA